MSIKEPIDEEIKKITDKANENIHKVYPLLDKPIEEWMTKEILEVYLKKGGKRK